MKYDSLMISDEDYTLNDIKEMIDFAIKTDTYNDLPKLFKYIAEKLGLQEKK